MQGVHVARIGHLAEHAADRQSGVETVEDARVDVRGAAHRRRVAEVARDLGDRAGLCALPGGLRSRGRRARDGEGDGRQDRGVPGAEVLRGEVAAGDLFHVRVDVAGPHVPPAPALAVGQQLRAAASTSLELGHDLVHHGVDHRLHAPAPALRGIVEGQRPVAELDVRLVHRGQAVGLVLRLVVLATDPEEAAVQQAHRTGEHPLRRKPLEGQVPGHAAAHERQGPRELDHGVELLLVAPLAPAPVVDVLLAATSVDSRRLDVAHRVGADPNVFPGRWDRELRDPLDHLRVLHAVAIRVDELEAAPSPAPRDPRACAIDPSQPCHGTPITRGAATPVRRASRARRRRAPRPRVSACRA